MGIVVIRSTRQVRSDHRAAGQRPRQAPKNKPEPEPRGKDAFGHDDQVEKIRPTPSTLLPIQVDDSTRSMGFKTAVFRN